MTNTMSRPTQANVAHSDINNHVTHGISNQGNYDLLTGSYNKIEPGTNARFPYHQLASAMDGSSHEQEDVTPLRAAYRIQRQDLVDRMPPSRGTMWDPVKDCRHSNTTRAQLHSLLSAGHDRSDVFKNSTIIQRGRQHQSNYGNGLSLPAYLRELSEQNANQAWEPLTMRAASMGTQPPQASYLHGPSHETGQPFKDMESGMLVSIGSDESVRSQTPTMQRVICGERF